MNNHLKLWRISLRGSLENYKPCFVVAPDATTAYNIVREELDTQGYGFTKERELLSIELMAEAYTYTNTGSRLFVFDKE